MQSRLGSRSEESRRPVENDENRRRCSFQRRCRSLQTTREWPPRGEGAVDGNETQKQKQRRLKKGEGAPGEEGEGSASPKWWSLAALKGTPLLGSTLVADTVHTIVVCTGRRAELVPSCTPMMPDAPLRPTGRFVVERVRPPVSQRFYAFLQESISARVTSSSPFSNASSTTIEALQ